MRVILLVLGGLSVAGSVALGVPAWVEHAELRGRWEQVRGVDPERSDRVYAASRSAHRKAGVGGLLGGLGALLLVAGWRRIEGVERASRTDLRVGLATAADGAAFLLVGALAFIDDGESAPLHALSSAAPALAFLPVAPLTWGRSLGLGLMGLRCAPSPGGILAAALLPLGLLATPLGLVFPGARALHLRLAGMHVVADEAGC